VSLIQSDAHVTSIVPQPDHGLALVMLMGTLAKFSPAFQN